MTARHPLTRPRVDAVGPPHAWPVCAVGELCFLLAGAEWSLVEFWAPQNLFSRLLAPVRQQLPASHGGRLRLLCCLVDGDCTGCAPFGVTALPCLVLFSGARRVRSWIGATDVSLLRHGIDFALADGAPTDTTADVAR